MERSLKRPRIGPSPFGETDIDDDELNSRPEDVNLRRDPGYQLQKSRAVAAFKLKSTFESIFEKYEKDFTGVGDEILLSTGEIAVNNGHLESLKDTRLDSVDDVEGENDVEEEERILQGKPDNRLSRLAQNPMPLTIQPRPPAFQAPWQSMGAPPMMYSMFPGPMPYSSYFPQPIPQSFDPTWNAPDLPMPTFVSAFNFMPPVPRVKAKQLLITAGNPDDEDDILLGVSAGTEKRPHVAKSPAESPLTPRPLENGSSEKDQLPASSEPKPAKSATKQIFRRPPEAATKSGSGKKRAAKKPLDLATPKLSSLTKSNKAPGTLKKLPGAVEATSPSVPLSSPSITGCKPRGRPRKAPEETTTHNKAGPDLYADASGPEWKFVPKPSSQRLQVEIRAMRSFDTSSYIRIASEPPLEAVAIHEPEPAHSTPQPNRESVIRAGADATDVEKALPSPPPPTVRTEPGSTSTAEPQKGVAKQTAQCPSPPVEVFSRNSLDPAYAFSDEDEPTLPKARVERRVLAQSASRPWTRQAALKNAPVAAVSESRPVPQKEKRRRSKKPASVQKPGALERPSTPLSTFEGTTVIEEEPAEEELVQGIEEAIEDQVVPAVDTSTFHLTSPVADDHAFPATSSPTRSRDARRAARNMASIPEADETISPDPMSSPPVPIPQQRSPSIILEPELPTRRRKRKLSDIEAEERISPNKPPIPFSSPGRIPRDQVIPETPGASSNRDPSPIRREPSPELGFRDPPPVPQPQEPAAADSPPPPSPPKPTTTTLAIHSKHHPKTPSSSSKTTTTLRRLSRPPTTTTTTPGSGRSRGILSLLSDDDDEDELSLGPDDFTPSGSRRRLPSQLHTTPSASRSKMSKTGASIRVSASAGKRNNGSLPPRTPATASKMKGRFGSVIFSRLKASGGGGGGGGLMLRDGVVSSPVPSRLGSEVIETPGGSRRRCGEGGWKCDRDFCFVCL